MVLYHLCAGVLLASGWYQPSLSTLAYIVIGCSLYLNNLICGLGSRRFYHLAMLISTFYLITKLLILFNLFTTMPQGFFIENLTFFNMIPDLSVLASSIFGFFDFRFLRFDRLNSINRMLNYCLLAFISLFFISLPCLLYMALLIYAIVSHHLFQSNHRHKVSVVVSLISTINLIYPYGLCLKELVTQGITSMPQDFLLQDWEMTKGTLILLIQVGSTIAACWNKDDLVNNRDIHEGLMEEIHPIASLANLGKRGSMGNRRRGIEIPLIGNESPEDKVRYIEKIKYVGLYTVTVVFLWVLLILFNGPIGIVLMAWIFYSILETNNRRIQKSIKFVLLPTVILTLIGFYFVNVLDSRPIELGYVFALESSMIQIWLMFFTVCSVSALYLQAEKLPDVYSFSKSFHQELLTLIFNQMYIFSLVVLFMVGLSDINLMHTVLMIICLVFMINPKIQEKKWNYLIYYTMAILGLRYSWVLLLPFLSLGESTLGLLDIIGLPRSRYTDYSTFIPYDYLIWVLLLSACIQDTAYNIKENNKDKIPTSTVIVAVNSIYDYVIHLEIWLIYLVIIIIQFVSNVNFLNMVRVVILFTIIMKHLYNTRNKINYNYRRAQKYFVMFEVYNGVLLATRYIYQFLAFFYDEHALDFHNIGLQVYNSKQLYGSTASDFALLLASVVASRNCRSINLRYSPVGEGDSDRKNSFFYKYFSNPFKFIILISIYTIAIFSKLSVAMLINIVIAGFYEMYIANYFTKEWEGDTIKDRNIKWQARATMWNMLFINTSLSMVLSYARFMVSAEIVPENLFSYVEWGFFICGYTKGEDLEPSIAQSYPYLVLFVLLIMERHCLQFILHPTLYCTGEGWISKDADYREERKLSKKEQRLNIDFIRVLNLFKNIAEALVPMLLLLLAFQKVTIISVFYVVQVLLGFCSQSLTNTRFLYYVLIIISIVQYTFILSNINEKTSNHMPKSEPPLDIPWYKSNDSHASYFLNLGTTLQQLHSVFYDMMTQVFIIMYYFHLSFREKQLIDKINKLKSSENQTGEESQDSDECPRIKTSRSQEDIPVLYADRSNEYPQLTLKQSQMGNLGPAKNETNLTKIKVVLIYVKEKFYQFSRYLVVGIALLFITQSLGLLSAFYCCFCLIFILKENEIYELHKTDSYLSLLTFFLRFLVLDLTLQIFIQLPFTYIEDPEFAKWCHFMGLMNIIVTENTDMEAMDSKYLTILFKIYTLFIVFMVHRMMQSEDYKNYIDSVFKELKNKSENIGTLMAKDFNNNRIKNNQLFFEKKAEFDKELTVLEDSIEIWNKQFTSAKKVDVRRFSTIKTALSGGVSKKSMSPYRSQPTLAIFEEKTHVNSIGCYLIDWINPRLFKSFLYSIRKHSVLPQKQKDKELKKKSSFAVLSTNFSLDINKMKTFGKIEESNSESDDSESSDILNHSEEVKDVDLNQSSELTKKENYDPQAKDYFFLILYAIASNPDYLVYLSFFLNHWFYASLESLLFPLSAMCYALIEYPRPPARYFKYMLIYAEVIFFVKFCLQLDIIFNDKLENFKDDWKIGFNLVKNTYSETLFFYVFWDVVVMIALLSNNYYLIKVGLWKQTEREIETLEQAKIRMNLIAVYQVQPHSETSSFLRFFNRLLPLNKQEKPGKDFYMYMVLIQMIILLYIFCFFSVMDGNSDSIAQALRSNQFQGRMVGFLILQVAIIIVERYFYVNRASQAIKDADSKDIDDQSVISKKPSLHAWIKSTASNSESLPPPKTAPPMESKSVNLENEGQENEEAHEESRSPMYFRVGIHLFLVLSVHVLVFWYLPLNGSSYKTLYCQDLYDADRCNNFQINYFIQGFYFLYLIYFLFASLQIKYGLPSFSKATFPLVRSSSQINYYLFKLYRTLPFVFEIRTLMDWIFSATALNLFQWFKFEDIYAQLFINQCYQTSLSKKKHGDQVGWLEKCYMGACGLFLILMVILLPLLIFSSLNPITIPNPVISASLDVRFIHNNRVFKLYTISSAEEILSLNSTYWESRGLSEVVELTKSDRDQMQKILMPFYSDSIWDISQPSKEKLCSLISNDINLYASQTISMLEVSYTFFREYPLSNPEVKLKEATAMDRNSLLIFNETICSKSMSTIVINNIFNQIIRLPSNGETITPIMIYNEHFKKDLILDLVDEEGGWGAYWCAMTDSNIDDPGVRFFTVSDQYSEVTMNISIITFYISIVYVVGALIKYSTRGSGMNVIMTDMRITKDLQILCEGIYISRMIGRFNKEEELYFELIDILRSPEIIKMITGSSSVKKREKDRSEKDKSN